MERRRRRREWRALWCVQPIPGALEKGVKKDFPCPYRELTLVPLGEKPKASRSNPVEGIRQFSFVPSEEGVPATRVQHGLAGCNN